MNAPLSLAGFDRLPSTVTTRVVAGLDAQIDVVAARAGEGHRFLRHGWYAAALAAYGGHARTLVVSEDALPVLALPFVAVGPAALKLASIPGSYWPFRGFPLALEASERALPAALTALGHEVRALRIGPVLEGDPAVTPLIAAASAAGWAVLDRAVAQSWRFDLPPPGEWPRTSTLKKNRFFEKHLAGHGVLEWRFLDAADWPHGFDLLAAIEEASWLTDQTDGSDAKFTAGGHGAFWRAAATDPVLAQSFRAALLLIDDAPAAFSFDVDDGAHRFAIANSYRPDIAKHSPGRLLHYRNLVRAREHGIRTVDWGAGDSGYKRTLGAEPGPVQRDWLLLRPGLPALTGKLLARWWRGTGAAID